MKKYFLVPHDHPNQKLKAGSVLVWDGLTSNVSQTDKDPEKPLLLMRPVFSNWANAYHLYQENLIEFVPATEPEPHMFPYSTPPLS
jgi:hypothetical protein